MRMQRQLGREDWILAGLKALASGPAAFRVETVARALGVTKGSFYWHFRDKGAWRDAVLAYWEHRVFARLALGRLPMRDGDPDWRAIDAGLHAWAAEDASVARSLARVLRERAMAGPRTSAAPIRRAA